MEAHHVDPELPDPTAADSWDALTAALRELHRRCGRPTYEALSARVGLPKSAISYLVGRNPVRSPSESTVLRFVEGCLGFAGLDPAVVRREVDRWRTAHRRLTELDASSAATAPDAPVPTPPAAAARPGRRSLRLVALAVGVAIAVVALVLVILGSGGARPPAAAGPGPVASSLGAASESPTASPGATPAANPSSATAAAGPQAGVRCVERAEPQSDARLHRDWPTVYYCPNRPAQVFTWAREDTKPIADLESRTSWFVCWAEGRSRDGGTEVFYYTQGDTTWRRPDLDAWGFVPASAVSAPTQPAAGVGRQCTFRVSA